MLNISAPEVIRIQIASDGKMVWIDTENGCIFRACRIKQLDLQDDRVPAEMKVISYQPTTDTSGLEEETK
jgi:hypothetical protein